MRERLNLPTRRAEHQAKLPPTEPHPYTAVRMQELTKAIATDISCRPEGAPITAAAFLHLGNRPAVSRALRALAKEGVILRAAHGVYLAPVVSRFGRHAPHAHLFIHQLAAQSGEAIAPFGAACANALGLTTQVPVKIVYWTSGRTRSYKLGKLTVYLQHVPDWQLVLWHEPAGELVRALAWAGPAEASKVLSQIAERVPGAATDRLQQHAHLFPPWLQDVLEQNGQPCARSISGERDVSTTKTQQNQRKRKAK